MTRPPCADRRISELTEYEVDALWSTDLHRRTPFLICWAGDGFLSVSRHSGGAVINGERYVYCASTDELMRHDVLVWRKTYRAQEAAALQTLADDAQQLGLYE